MPEPETDCVVRFPKNPTVICELAVHPHRVSHQGSGQEPDGTRWVVRWWHPSEALDDPEGIANHEPGEPSPGQYGAR